MADGDWSVMDKTKVYALSLWWETDGEHSAWLVSSRDPDMVCTGATPEKAMERYRLSLEAIPYIEADLKRRAK